VLTQHTMQLEAVLVAVQLVLKLGLDLDSDDICVEEGSVGYNVHFLSFVLSSVLSYCWIH